MADGQIVLVAVTTFAQRLDVLKGGLRMRHMRTADPTRHHAMQLARYRFVDFVARELEATQGFTPLDLLMSWLDPIAIVESHATQDMTAYT